MRCHPGLFVVHPRRYHLFFNDGDSVAYFCPLRGSLGGKWWTTRSRRERRTCNAHILLMERGLLAQPLAGSNKTVSCSVQIVPEVTSAHHSSRRHYTTCRNSNAITVLHLSRRYLD
ncbi:hypothetical protein TcCL_NonESM00384 [Trypanosoma cruzi]|nr:hypothetical protein TcCL_NonESM00384 [Trypanosoma cruzi]